MRRSAELRVGLLYPDHLNLYGDRGNVRVLRQRCRWRGIGFREERIGIGDTLDPAAHDLLYLAGGPDRDQARCAEDLVTTKRAPLSEAAARGVPVLGVCAGFQLLGRSYERRGLSMPGAGLVDVRTVAGEATRLVGDVVVEVDLGEGPRRLVGFENHAGRTLLGPGERPLGRILEGHGNNGEDGTEGVWRGSVMGTYVHGPLLAMNAWFADRLIAMALGRDTLPPLDDRLEHLVHRRAGVPAARASANG